MLSQECISVTEHNWKMKFISVTEHNWKMKFSMQSHFTDINTIFEYCHASLNLDNVDFCIRIWECTCI